MVKFDSDQVPTRTVSAHRECDYNGVRGKNVVERLFSGPLTTCVDLSRAGWIRENIGNMEGPSNAEKTWKGAVKRSLEERFGKVDRWLDVIQSPDVPQVELNGVKS